MTRADHIRLAFSDRLFSACGDEIIFDDGLPGPTEEELAATYDQALALWQAEQTVPVQWDNAQDFMAAFTMQEKAAIALSTDPAVAALRFELSTWFSIVLPSDQRVQTGLDRLVQCSIITAERKTEIITTAH
jgi:hypothetical protein